MFPLFSFQQHLRPRTKAKAMTYKAKAKDLTPKAKAKARP